jgi:hypothetical protein
VVSALHRQADEVHSNHVTDAPQTSAWCEGVMLLREPAMYRSAAMARLAQEQEVGAVRTLRIARILPSKYDALTERCVLACAASAPAGSLKALWQAS